MSNFIDYLSWRGDLDFKMCPFNHIDALILSQLSYLDFTGIIGDDFNKKVTIKDCYEQFLKLPDYEKRIDLGVMINKKTINLFCDCSNSNRFKNVLMTGYKNVYDKEKEIQFSAITFCISKKMSVVAYRGTDDTLIGWKEDFNLSYLTQLPSQLLSIEYLEEACQKIKNDIIVAGHSKGGNLSIYASVKCNPKYQKRLSKVYNFDGPGFDKSFFLQDSFLRIKNRINNFYPKFSVVGMIFSHFETYKIVDSNEFAVMQHDPFSWQMQGNDFVYNNDFTDESKFFYKAFNEWISEISIDDKKNFVNTLFSILFSVGVETNSELEDEKLQNSTKIISSIAKLDSKSKDFLFDIIKLFGKVAKNSIPIFNLFSI